MTEHDPPPSLAQRDDAARGPRALGGLRRTAPPTKAAGLRAIRAALEHMKREGYGALEGTRELARMNQKDGFDCSGCAWPDPDGHRSSVAEYCENGAKAFAEEATKKRCDPAFFERHSVDELARLSDFELSQAGRLTEPMVLRSGATHYAPISWDEAFAVVGDALRGLANPDEAFFYTSG
ncbi:MAG: hypothetical protein VXZ39_01655, partial [Planctomycetota bacterium]|nr:hypothetical protein [Planctomycetota bacterium]